jgi:hypothetical protein
VKLFLSLLFTGALSASEPYAKTDGPLTIYVLDWDPSANIPGWLSPHPAPSGVWISVCTTDGKPPSKAIVTFRIDSKDVVIIKPLSVPPNGSCSSAVVTDIKKSNIVSVLIVTGSIEVTDISH